jgi:hypothetical protein
MSRHLILAVCVATLCVFAPGRTNAQADFSDAEYLAYESSDSLLAPDSLVAKFDHDLQLIRQHTPAVVDVHHSCERWRLGTVELTFSYGAAALFLAGQHEGLNALHAQLGNPQLSWLIGYSCIFYYPRPYNPSRLVELHTGLDGVSAVHAVWTCIGDGPNIVLRPDGTYLFKDAWGENCQAGLCDYSHTWIFSVEGEVVTLVDEFGDVVPAAPVSWGRVKALFR